MLAIYTILCRPGTMDNYAYLLLDKESNISAVIDPSSAEPIIKKCDELNLRPEYILNTHHHFDHTDGNLELKKLWNAKVIGSDERIPGLDTKLNNNDTFSIGNSTTEVIDVSAHTIGHCLYYFKQDKTIFTGDTLFNLSIGGLFEGDPRQMFNALQKIKSLPDDTLFYPGHEYTVYGLENCKNEEYKKIALQRLQKSLPTHPITLEMEKKPTPI